MIKVTYIDHSGFAVTTPTAVIVFDYYKDPDKKLEKVLREANDNRPVLFFVSHHHPDHFNTSIFELAQDRERYYVLSNDIFSKLVPDKAPAVAWMSAGDVIEQIPGIKKVKAYGSTDTGVSYMLTLDDAGTTLFHAGDLNNWGWEDDARESRHEADKMEAKFRTIVNRIAEDYPKIDIVMFPVDARLGGNYADGAREFLTRIKVDHFFPMHFWGEPQKACNFSDYVPLGQVKETHCLDKPGQEAEIYIP